MSEVTSLLAQLSPLLTVSDPVVKVKYLPYVKGPLGCFHLSEDRQPLRHTPCVWST